MLNPFDLGHHRTGQNRYAQDHLVLKDKPSDRLLDRTRLRG
jgi:hypothetical protein